MFSLLTAIENRRVNSPAWSTPSGKYDLNSSATALPSILSPCHAEVLTCLSPPNPIGSTSDATRAETAECQRSSFGGGDLLLQTRVRARGASSERRMARAAVLMIVQRVGLGWERLRSPPFFFQHLI